MASGLLGYTNTPNNSFLGRMTGYILSIFYFISRDTFLWHALYVSIQHVQRSRSLLNSVQITNMFDVNWASVSMSLLICFHSCLYCRVWNELFVIVLVPRDLYRNTLTREGGVYAITKFGSLKKNGNCFWKFGKKGSVISDRECARFVFSVYYFLFPGLGSGGEKMGVIKGGKKHTLRKKASKRNPVLSSI